MATSPFSEFPVSCARGSRVIQVAGRLIDEGKEGAQLHLLFREGGETGTERTVSRGAVPSGLRFFVALEGEVAEEGGREGSFGSVVVPYGVNRQGSTIYLPFQASEIIWFDACDSDQQNIKIYQQKWTGWRWGEVASREEQRKGEFIRPESLGEVLLPFSPAQQDRKNGRPRRFIVYAKEMHENGGWGQLLMATGRSMAVTLERVGGIGDFYIPSSLTIHSDSQSKISKVEEVFPAGKKIYQLFPRLFNNIKSDLLKNGTLAINGCGKWEGITHAALDSIRAMGFTDIWLTGTLQHATGTDYRKCGLPSDPPDLLKGVAGSPFALKNPFGLSPDCAVVAENRLEEFRALVKRIHDAGMGVCLDFTPNHLARCFVVHPLKNRMSLAVGAKDDVSRFFWPQNYFYYVQEGKGEGVRLPTIDRNGEPTTVTCQTLGGCSGRHEGEKDFVRVTGNNVTSSTPSLNDWYETVKLNYGFNFLTDEGSYPSALSADEGIPPVWHLMDAVLAHWQKQGVDGFRCDMAHMIPPEFWMWAIARARQRAARAGCEVYFVAEAYDEDPMRVSSRNPILRSLYDGMGNVGVNLIDAGFDLIYDGGIYKKLKEIYDGAAWANDLDQCLLASPLVTEHGLRYAENHDEVRLASASHGNWGGIGMNVGRPVCGILYGAAVGGILLYNGQEVGEAGEDAGYGGGNGRTTIFDYWSMPELQKWVNEGRYDGEGLAADQLALRDSYARLLALVSRPAFRNGMFLPLNGANLQSGNFGRLPGETASGHWIYAFLRYDPTSGELFLVVVNLHASEAFRHVEIVIPEEVLCITGLAPGETIRMEDKLSSRPALVLKTCSDEIVLPVVPPLTPYYFEVERMASR